MPAGLQITSAGPPYIVKLTVDTVKYTLSTGSPGFVPVEHRQGCIDAAAAKGVTLTAVVI